MLDQEITGFLVKHASIAIPDPSLTTKGNWTVLYRVTRHLVMYLHSRDEFRSRYHTQILIDGRAYIWRLKAHKAGDDFTSVAGDLSQIDTHSLIFRQNM